MPVEVSGPRRRSSISYPWEGLQDRSSALPSTHRATTVPPLDPMTLLVPVEGAPVVPAGPDDDGAVGFGGTGSAVSRCLTWSGVSGSVPVPAMPEPIALTARMPTAVAAAAPRSQPPTGASQRGREDKIGRDTAPSMPAATLTAH